MHVRWGQRNTYYCDAGPYFGMTALRFAGTAYLDDDDLTNGEALIHVEPGPDPREDPARLGVPEQDAEHLPNAELADLLGQMPALRPDYRAAVIAEAARRLRLGLAEQGQADA